jgi:hypothetical protein
MDRRKLLKVLGVSAAGLALPISKIKAKPATEKSLSDIHLKEVLSWKVDPKFKVYETFEMTKLNAGEIPTFPLDFIADPSRSSIDKRTKCSPAYTITNTQRQPERFVNSDYIYIPSYDIGYSDDTVSKVIEGMQKKVNKDAAVLLK